MPWSKSNKKHYLYWIRLPQHIDIYSEGYIGVTGVSVGARFKRHVSSANRADIKKGSRILVNALIKHGHAGMIVDTLVIGDRDYIYNLEHKLRPVERVGWNTVAGGAQSPAMNSSVKKKIGDSNKGKVRSSECKKLLSERLKGRVVSEQTRQRMSVARTGKKINRRPIKPWNHNRASEESILIWSNADALYAQWLYYDKPKAIAFCSKLQVPIKKSIRTMVDMFISGWVPRQDLEWEKRFAILKE